MQCVVFYSVWNYFCLADISATQILANEQKDRNIQFSLCLFNFNGRKAISPIETQRAD